MAESKFRRGVSVNSTGPQVAPHHTSKPIGRVHKSVGRVPEPLPQNRFDPHQHQESPGILDAGGVPVAARRQGLVTPGGEPIRRGLAQGTLDARDQVTNAEERCERCGKDRPSKLFKVLVQSSDNGNLVRVCQGCASQAYKNPYPDRSGSFSNNESWRMQRQDVRFSRADGRPYDGSRMQGNELLNGDSFHETDYDSDVAPTLGAQQQGRVGKIRS